MEVQEIWKEHTNLKNVNVKKFMDSVNVWAQKMAVELLQADAAKAEKYYQPRSLTVSVVFFFQKNLANDK